MSIVGGAIAVDNDAGSEFWPMFVPVVGPFLTIATHDRNATSSVLLAIDGLGQSAGLAMLIAGLVLENKFLRYRGAGLELGPSVQIGASGAGVLGVEGRF